MFFDSLALTNILLSLTAALLVAIIVQLWRMQRLKKKKTVGGNQVAQQE